MAQIRKPKPPAASLSAEQRASFGGYSILCCAHMEPGQVLHDLDAHIIWVRDSETAAALIADLNAAAEAIRQEADANFLRLVGIEASLEITSG